jgi:crotonobetainyl-CoA:carnitine CoA-transferase CaiB-like acyl-CoA transferase
MASAQWPRVSHGGRALRSRPLAHAGVKILAFLPLPALAREVELAPRLGRSHVDARQAERRLARLGRPVAVGDVAVRIHVLVERARGNVERQSEQNQPKHPHAARLATAMPLRNALYELLQAGDLPQSLATDVSFSGADPVLPTPYRIGTAGAAALAAVGLAVSDVWFLRTKRKQRVSVDVPAAAASLRSARYLKIDGKPPPNPWDPLSGYYPVRGGRWVSIHSNFPNHRDAAMKVLGAGLDREAAEQASRKWEGLELEEAIHAAGGCAALARTAAEWSAHPHSSAVAREPLIEIRKISDSKPEPLKDEPRPLSGIRVLDLTRVLAGPTCARTLAEHGAEVLKISAAHLPDSGPTEIDTGLGKLSAFVDLRKDEGRNQLKSLLAQADVFSQSYRPGALAARGFSPDEAARVRPGIVYVTLSAWGAQGPWSARRGFDSIVQTVSGMAVAQTGGSDPAQKPKLMPVSAIDYVSGYLMAYGALVALARRAREGGSWLVRVSLARTGKWIVDRGFFEGFLEVPEDLPAGALRKLLEERETPYGRVAHLKPVLELSETPARWDRPPVPLGSSPAAWP